jgi:hypothetical protein
VRGVVIEECRFSKAAKVRNENTILFVYTQWYHIDVNADAIRQPMAQYHNFPVYRAIFEVAYAEMA